MKCWTALGLSLLFVWASPCCADLEPGDKVEVKFAGTWLPATVLKREGVRTQVKLESGMERRKRSL
jgi:hypothetical protein